MNCDSYHQDLLLRQSGELDADQTARLGSHLRVCAGCRDYEAGLVRITQVAELALAAGEPSEAALAEICSVARARSRRAALPLVFGLPRVVAYAAMLMALLGSGAFLTGRAWKARQHENRVAALSAVIGLVSGHMPKADQATADRDATLRDLAGQLLQLEGLGEEELTADNGVSSPAVEPEPTDLQSHSSGELPLTEYG